MVSKLLSEAIRQYESKTSKSKTLYGEAKRLFPGGIQHNIRFFQPYPFYVNRAGGQHLNDVDGNQFTDRDPSSTRCVSRSAKARTSAWSTSSR
jgi:4-aminobutyrate aminotransferase-like enzyme